MVNTQFLGRFNQEVTWGAPYSSISLESMLAEPPVNGECPRVRVDLECCPLHAPPASRDRVESNHNEPPGHIHGNSGQTACLMFWVHGNQWNRLHFVGVSIYIYIYLYICISICSRSYFWVSPFLSEQSRHIKINTFLHAHSQPPFFEIPNQGWANR